MEDHRTPETTTADTTTPDAKVVNPVDPPDRVGAFLSAVEAVGRKKLGLTTNFAAATKDDVARLARVEQTAGALFVAAQVALGGVIAERIEAAPADGSKAAVIEEFKDLLDRGKSTVKTLSIVYRKVRDGKHEVPDLVEVAKGGWKAFVEALSTAPKKPALTDEEREAQRVANAVGDRGMGKLATDLNTYVSSHPGDGEAVVLRLARLLFAATNAHPEPTGRDRLRRLVREMVDAECAGAPADPDPVTETSNDPAETEVLVYRYHRSRWAQAVDEDEFCPRAADACALALERDEVEVELVDSKADAGLSVDLGEEAAEACETSCDEVYAEMRDE